jgi:hypothetical protein
MKRLTSTIAVLMLCTNTAGAAPLPTNPDVTPDNIATTICVSGYSHTVRPPSQVTGAIKRRLLSDAGLPPDMVHDFILDHIIPISVGGSPDDPRNMVLQPKAEASLKDRAENRAHSLVCTHRLDLRQAQQTMWSDWRRLLPARALQGDGF